MIITIYFYFVCAFIFAGIVWDFTGKFEIKEPFHWKILYIIFYSLVWPLCIMTIIGQIVDELNKKDKE